MKDADLRTTLVMFTGYLAATHEPLLLGGPHPLPSERLIAAVDGFIEALPTMNDFAALGTEGGES